MYPFHKSNVHFRTNFKQKQKLETSKHYALIEPFDIIFAIETFLLICNQIYGTIHLRRRHIIHDF